ncbi:MAG: hypothetical protein E5X53_08320 [Mesorhizobium sp.]|uniref:hypothetical protein n=1 Tax=Mesorhizobium sp. TaxID=1871066 RepID=UPI0012072EA5|nr:hypothetical protein [Mesorhizobium sp.]TIP75392.1 MAG: hypothetical protein E5X55_04275 [Mesorhizobium sp.]TIR53007.1 MAG: hypothetical protein E5X53_08320 [Mesorhizobium sp.]TJV98647.1 MAG: hypothetical protein E5X52_08075 [Mesorhizobium sp.]
MKPANLLKALVRPRGVLVSRKIKHLGCPTGRRAPIENIAAFAPLSNRPAVSAAAASTSENWSEMASKAQIVDAAGRLFGARAARQLWQDLGLPLVGKSPGPPDLSLLLYVAAFVEARLVADCRVGIAARQLHTAYIDWADETGAPHLSLTRFGLLMPRTGIRRVAGRIVTYEARFK